MSPHREWFINFLDVQHESVTLGNDEVCRVYGISSIKLQMFNKFFVTLNNVRFIPELKSNLVSLGALVSKRCEFRY